MRALCGAIITAGALIGLGLAALGIGVRYHNLAYNLAKPDYVKWSGLDTPLMVIVTLLICAVLVGLAVAFVGLAYHHERRHRERLREMGEPRVHV